MTTEITVLLPDRSERSLPEGSTGTTLATSIGRRLAEAAVAVEVDGELWDLERPLPDRAKVSIVTR